MYESDSTVQSTERVAFVPTSSSNSTHSSPNSFTKNIKENNQKEESTTEQNTDTTTQKFVTKKSQIDNKVVTTIFSKQKNKKKYTTNRGISCLYLKFMT